MHKTKEVLSDEITNFYLFSNETLVPLASETFLTRDNFQVLAEYKGESVILEADDFRWANPETGNHDFVYGDDTEIITILRFNIPQKIAKFLDSAIEVEMKVQQLEEWIKDDIDD